MYIVHVDLWAYFLLESRSSFFFFAMDNIIKHFLYLTKVQDRRDKNEHRFFSWGRRGKSHKGSKWRRMMKKGEKKEKYRKNKVKRDPRLFKKIIFERGQRL